MAFAIALALSSEHIGFRVKTTFQLTKINPNRYNRLTFALYESEKRWNRMGRLTAHLRRSHFFVDSTNEHWRNMMHGNRDDNTLARHTIGWKFKKRDGTALMSGAGMCAFVMRMRYAEATINQFIYSLSITIHKCVHKQTDDFSRFSSMDFTWIYLIARCTIWFVNYSFRTRLTRRLFTLTLCAENEHTTQFSLFFSSSYYDIFCEVHCLCSSDSCRRWTNSDLSKLPMFHLSALHGLIEREREKQTTASLLSLYLCTNFEVGVNVFKLYLTVDASKWNGSTVDSWQFDDGGRTLFLFHSKCMRLIWNIEKPRKYCSPESLTFFP